MITALPLVGTVEEEEAFFWEDWKVQAHQLKQQNNRSLMIKKVLNYSRNVRNSIGRTRKKASPRIEIIAEQSLGLCKV